MVTKIKPKASIAFTEGMDGRDSHYYIIYHCPTCNRLISFYRSNDACDECGTFYDWGSREPYIKMKPVIIGW
jgi:hypothetical protein